jgi:O-antigen/teichoic acid export membrane protein
MVVLILLLGVNLVLSIVEAVQAGYQRQYLNNLWATFGNILMIGMFLLVISYWRSITGVIIAVYGATTVAKILNVGQLLWSRPYLVPRWSKLDKTIARMLVGTGLAFFLGQLASLLYLQFSIFLVGRQLGPSSAVGFAVMIQMLSLAGGMVIMVTLPLWPAIADAWARGDRAWITNAYKKATFGLMTYAILVGAVIAIAGSLIVTQWISSEVAPSAALRGLSGVYFILVIHQNINYTFLIGIGQIRSASFGLLAGGIVMMIASVWLVNVFGSSGVVLGMCIGLFITAWFFPLLMNRTMKSEC